ncbi:hypothetical protein ACFFWD_22765 [Bradyrhizobium erythrophlei]|uniref:hypothetical protein n=1 Tax=Bradyrhizobium erythrophlei TaxID=1437360 RepID=UPI0035ECB9D5
MGNKISGHVIAWIVCIGISLIIAEIAGAVLFYQQQGRAGYLNRRGLTDAVRSGPAEKPPQRIHPYLGFGGTISRNDVWVTNNLGFSQSTPYKVPFQPSPRDFVVVVFGGSVASNLVAPPQSGLPLQAAVQELLPDKNVIVYSMAQGSGKQPQQLMALSLLLALGQHIDVVVNLDAFNEFALGYENVWYHVHPIYPSLSILWGIGKGFEPVSEKADNFYRIAADLVEAKSAIRRRTDAANRSRSGLSYLANKTLISFHMRRKAQAESDYASAKGTSPAELDGIKAVMGVDMPYANRESPWEDIFQIWLHSSDAMAALSRSVGAKYLHIVQPNQYFSKKHFSADEAKIALSLPPTTPMRIGAEHLYPMIEQRSQYLRDRGIISGVGLLDDQTDAMYVDNCCHYTRAGETILARFVAGQIVHR